MGRTVARSGRPRVRLSHPASVGSAVTELPTARVATVASFAALGPPPTVTAAASDARRRPDPAAQRDAVRAALACFRTGRSPGPSRRRRRSRSTRERCGDRPTAGSWPHRRQPSRTQPGRPVARALRNLGLPDAPAGTTSAGCCSTSSPTVIGSRTCWPRPRRAIRALWPCRPRIPAAELPAEGSAGPRGRQRARRRGLCLAATISPRCRSRSCWRAGGPTWWSASIRTRPAADPAAVRGDHRRRGRRGRRVHRNRCRAAGLDRPLTPPALKAGGIGPARSAGLARCRLGRHHRRLAPGTGQGPRPSRRRRDRVGANAARRGCSCRPQHPIRRPGSRRVGAAGGADREPRPRRKGTTGAGQRSRTPARWAAVERHGGRSPICRRGTAVTAPDALGERVDWHPPAWVGPRDPAIATIWAEAHQLGALAQGASDPLRYCPAGRRPGRSAGGRRRSAPPRPPLGRFGSDLTVMVAGAPPPRSAPCWTPAPTGKAGAPPCLAVLAGQRAARAGRRRDRRGAGSWRCAVIAEIESAAAVDYLIGDVQRRHGS